MNDPQRAFFESILREPSAIELCELLGAITQTWDDLVDNDKPVSANDINHMMWNALFTLDENPFYSAYRSELRPLFKQAVLDWFSANQMEERGGCVVSYVIRDSVSAMMVSIVGLDRGWGFAKQVAPAIRGYIHDEPFEDYLNKLKEASDGKF